MTATINPTDIKDYAYVFCYLFISNMLASAEVLSIYGSHGNKMAFQASSENACIHDFQLF